MWFDHLGLLVPDLTEGRDHLSTIFPIDAWSDVVEDTLNGVVVQFGRDQSGLCYELVMPVGKRSPVAAALPEGRRILHHVAYRVADLAQAAASLRAQHCVAVGRPNPAIAYQNARIQFFISPLKFLIELIEAPDHAQRYRVLDNGFLRAGAQPQDV